MKIGVLTLPFNVNYGGILQAYALQVYLESLGHEVIFIDRTYGRPSFVVLLMRILSFCKCVVKKILLRDRSVVLSNPFGSKYITKQYKDLDWSRVLAFASTYLHSSPPLIRTKEVRKFVNYMQFDCLLVGSDQVWRDCYTPNVYNYFFDFAKRSKIKKISYAASFGVYDAPIPWYKLNKCIKLAHKFESLSVREDAAVDYMQRVFDLSPQKVADPTLLLTESDYSVFVKEDNSPASKYAVAYILNMSAEKIKILNLVQSYLKVELIILSSEPNYNTNVQYAVSVEEWITQIANAQFVVTDSFHGCVFAILFNKQFLAIANECRGNERFISLLTSLGLIDRLVFSYEQVLSILNQGSNAIDYKEVQEKIGRVRQTSKDFLLTALNGK